MKKIMLDVLLENKKFALESEDYSSVYATLIENDKKMIQKFLEEGFEEENRPDLIYLNSY